MTCALHCLLTPLLVASVSLGAIGWLASEGMELALLSLATTLAAAVLGWGWRRIAGSARSACSRSHWS